MKCFSHIGKEIGRNEDESSRGFICRDCLKPVELCNCISDGEGQVDHECLKCLGSGWVLKGMSLK